MLMPSIAAPFTEAALAVAIAALFMMGGPTAHAFRVWSRRHRPQCTQCGRRPDRGGPPLLYFRDRGLRCADCVLGSPARPPRTTRSGQGQSPPATLTSQDPSPLATVTGHAGAGGHHMEEVHSRVAA